MKIDPKQLFVLADRIEHLMGDLDEVRMNLMKIDREATEWDDYTLGELKAARDYLIEAANKAAGARSGLENLGHYNANR